MVMVAWFEIACMLWPNARWACARMGHFWYALMELFIYKQDILYRGPLPGSDRTSPPVVFACMMCWSIYGFLPPDSHPFPPERIWGCWVGVGVCKNFNRKYHQLALFFWIQKQKIRVIASGPARGILSVLQSDGINTYILCRYSHFSTGIYGYGHIYVCTPDIPNNINIHTISYIYW